MDENRLFYDLKANEYAKEWYKNECMLPSINEFLDLINKEKPVVLDLGCGPGNESSRLHKLGADVIGIDYSAESIKIARDKNPELTFYEMDYSRINSKIGLFDGIFSCSSLIHHNKKEIEAVLDKINLIIRKNGIFLIIYRVGKGKVIQNHDINGIKLKRTIETFTKNEIIEIFSSKDYGFIRQGIIDNSLTDNWDSLLFKKLH